jgi:hypothetical protein
MKNCGLGVQPRSHIDTLESARKCEGMSSHTPKWTPTLGVKVLMNFRIFKELFEWSKFISSNYALTNLLFGFVQVHVSD